MTPARPKGTYLILLPCQLLRTSTAREKDLQYRFFLQFFQRA